MISVEVSVGVGGKWTCGESKIFGQVENGKGLLDAVSVSDETKAEAEGRPFKIGRGAAGIIKWNGGKLKKIRILKV